MLYIKLFIEREKNTGQSAPECPFKVNASTEDRIPCRCSTILTVVVVVVVVVVYK